MPCSSTQICRCSRCFCCCCSGYITRSLLQDISTPFDQISLCKGHVYLCTCIAVHIPLDSLAGLPWAHNVGAADVSYFHVLRHENKACAVSPVRCIITLAVVDRTTGPAGQSHSRLILFTRSTTMTRASFYYHNKSSSLLY